MIEIKAEINPETARSLGFEWLKDVQYDTEAPNEVNLELEELIKSGEYVLGLPASNNPENCIFGLYKVLTIDKNIK